jgi:serine protease Do
MIVQHLTPDVAKQLGLPPSTTGVVVSQVDPSSSAATAGIQQGDVIQEVNRKPVRKRGPIQKALAGTANQSALLLVNRGGTTRFVAVQPL